MTGIAMKSRVGAMHWTTGLTLAIVTGFGASASASAEQAADRVAIIAHRGASAAVPQNTLAAINLAWEQGADMVEIDLRLTSDGHIVIVHNRTARAAGTGYVVAETPLRVLRSLTIGTWEGEPQRIPTLLEALQAVPEGKRVLLHIKDKINDEIANGIARALDQADLNPHQVLFFCNTISDELEKAIPNFSQYTQVWLWGVHQDEQSGEWNHTFRRIIARMERGGFDTVNATPATSSHVLDAQIIRTFHEHGLTVYASMVGNKDAQLVRELSEAGADGFMSNDPGWLVEQLKGLAPRDGAGAAANEGVPASTSQ